LILFGKTENPTIRYHFPIKFIRLSLVLAFILAGLMGNGEINFVGGLGLSIYHVAVVPDTCAAGGRAGLVYLGLPGCFSGD
jgi:hypothetical protein